MTYTILIERKAQKSLSKITHQTQDRIIEAIRALAHTPNPSGSIKLTGREAWRIRVGEYRIIYEIVDGELRICVIAIGHRRDIYR